MSTVHVVGRLIEGRSLLKHPLYQACQRGERSLEAPVAAGAAE